MAPLYPRPTAYLPEVYTSHPHQESITSREIRTSEWMTSSCYDVIMGQMRPGCLELAISTSVSEGHDPNTHGQLSLPMDQMNVARELPGTSEEDSATPLLTVSTGVTVLVVSIVIATIALFFIVRKKSAFLRKPQEIVKIENPLYSSSTMRSSDERQKTTGISRSCKYSKGPVLFTGPTVDFNKATYRSAAAMKSPSLPNFSRTECFSSTVDEVDTAADDNNFSPQESYGIYKPRPGNRKPSNGVDDDNNETMAVAAPVDQQNFSSRIKKLNLDITTTTTTTTLNIPTTYDNDHEAKESLETLNYADHGYSGQGATGSHDGCSWSTSRDSGFCDLKCTRLPS